MTPIQLAFHTILVEDVQQLYVTSDTHPSSTAINNNPGHVLHELLPQ